MTAISVGAVVSLGLAVHASELKNPFRSIIKAFLSTNTRNGRRIIPERSKTKTKIKTKTESESESETVRQASQPDCASSVALHTGSAIASYADLISNLYPIDDACL
jgi:hypothetical protein